MFSSIEKGFPVDIVYFDLAKAFDRLNHQVLMNKLATLADPYYQSSQLVEFTLRLYW